MGTDYAEHLKQVLARDLPALKCRIRSDDISVREKPDGDYAVGVRIRTDTVDIPGTGQSVDTGRTVHETYSTDEALETKGAAYRAKTRRLAEKIRDVPRSR